MLGALATFDNNPLAVFLGQTWLEVLQRRVLSDRNANSGTLEERVEGSDHYCKPQGEQSGY